MKITRESICCCVFIKIYPVPLSCHFLLSSVVFSARSNIQLLITTRVIQKKWFHCSFAKYIYFDTAKKTPPHPSIETFLIGMFPFSELNFFVIPVCAILWKCNYYAFLDSSDLSRKGFQLPLHTACIVTRQRLSLWSPMPPAGFAFICKANSTPIQKCHIA